MKDYKEYFWQNILPHVQKPTRYLGNEVNAVVKDHKECSMKMVLAFPDMYEIGMSHLGLKILYHIINQNEQWLAERVFMPDTDLEDRLRQESFPLCSLETVTPLSSFDLVGFTLQYELSYATILHMLELGGIPKLAAARTDADPLVAGGGPGAFNPEPLADFFDFFVIGDAEEALPQVLLALEEKILSRQDKLKRISEIQGVYVPAFYQAEYGEDGSYSGTHPAVDNLPGQVQRAVISDLNAAPYPTDFIVPYGGIVHDRLVLELFRGCTRGCRFCQAGIIYRPVRERTPSKLRELAGEMVRSTGYDELALSSLSSGDYSAIEQLVTELGQELAQEGVSLSLPSLRLDSFSGELAEQVQRVRKSGLTFAPEAGTQRLRDVINKNISEEDLLNAVTDAFQSGWTGVKLYFMIGLPTETDEDLLGIADLAQKVVQAYRQAGKKGKPRVTVSASVFVPKAHTPFQWEGQISRQEMLRRQDLLRNALRGKGVQFQWHGAETSLVEAALARGGRDLVPVIDRAAELGSKLDGWDEHFSFARWESAFADNGLDLATYAAKSYALEEPLPWDHIDSGVTKKFLKRELERALAGEVTKDCRENCLGCGMTLLMDSEESKGACNHAFMD
ncbi:TIGR03960 family B12-binding radical SAM protein [Dethiobacter alkaliphilus]|uniref:Radical SAM domain protein n=1 Tax=Dethiobacter alkaliphilus AHT 1 TaxID=555088 RepID=C0GEV4_DETAL|nr:TIGR03960 family B12-binding radical SAM protein [Dethiobacter alkaliphilus]EEG78136.1 Radical SAM domain protein [Dethiobacter alkaliphilus AHT 1]